MIAFAWLFMAFLLEKGSKFAVFREKDTFLDGSAEYGHILFGITMHGARDSRFYRARVKMVWLR
jgi:hypothetical protein